MTLFLALAAGLWVLGHLLRTPPSARWITILLLYVAVLGVHVALPEGNPLRRALGGTAGEWMVLGGLGVLIWAYSRVLRRVRARVRPENRRPEADAPENRPPENRPSGTAPAAGAFAPGELDRYARHIVLREIGGLGQRRLKQARVLVVGAGGLGAPALQYLAAAGVGTIGVIDDDVVEATNLQRQVIHADAWIGRPKVFSAESAMRAQNPFVTVRPYHRRLEEGIAADLLSDYDLVLDGTDHFPTRLLVNRTAVSLGKPLVSGALAQWEGQVGVFDPASAGPCYACLFPDAPAPGLAPTCAEAGVFAPLPGVVGAMMAAEAIKLVTGAGEPLRGRLLIYDALYAEVRIIRIPRRPDCPVCGSVAR